jgi:two-component system, sensor histidine kinase PdtaS
LRELITIGIICCTWLSFGQNIQTKREKLANPYAFVSDRTGFMSDALDLVVYYQERNEDSATYYIDLALPVAEQIKLTDNAKDVDLAAGIFSVKGYWFHRRSNPIESINWFQKAADYYMIFQNQSGLIEVLNNLAVQYKTLGDYTKAISYQEQALSEAQIIGDSITIANSLHNLSSIFREYNDFGKAIELSEDALRICREIGSRDGEARVLNSLAGLAKITGDTVRALELYEKALSIRKELNDFAGEAVLLNNIGVIYKQQKDFNAALDYFFRSLSISKETNQIVGSAHAFLNISETYLDLNDLNKALQYGMDGYQIGKATQNASILKKATKLLMEVYKSQQRWKEAFAMQEEYMELYTTMMNDQSYVSLQQATLKYAYEKEQMLLQKEQEQNEALNEERNFREKLFNYFSTGLALLLLIFVFVIAHRLRIVRQKNRVIEQQNDERKLLLQEVHHRVKNNFQIVSSLLRLQSYTIDDELLNRTIEEAVTRINAMAAVHDIIYRQEEFSNIQTSEYLVRLSQTLQKTVADRNIEFEIDTDDSIKDIELLIHLGIVINELVINSIKYAFPKDHLKPTISISLKQNGERFILVYKDNGIGMEQAPQNNSFGMELIETIVEQIDGELTMTSEENWNTVIKILFDFKPKKRRK